MKERLLISILLSLSFISALSQNSKGIEGTPDAYIETPSKLFSSNPKTLRLLSIGVDNFYAFDSFPPLSFPSRDCQLFSKTVHSVFSFDYRVLSYGSQGDKLMRDKKDIEWILNSIAEDTSNDELVLIFLSGHGVIFENNGQSEYFFITYDTDASNIQGTSVSGSFIRAAAASMARRGARVVLIVDSCHSGAIITGSSKDQTSNVFYLTSCDAEGSTIELADKGTTLFTYYLQSLLLEGSNTASLSFSHIASQLASKTGGQSMSHYDKDFVLITDFDKKVNYENLRKQYEKYISDSESALLRHEYTEAFKLLNEAFILSKQIGNDTGEIDILANRICVLAKNDLDRYQNDFDNPIWEQLVLINDNTPFVDDSILSMKRLYALCGKYYFNKQEYQKAQDSFSRAFLIGEREVSPTFILNISNSHGVSPKEGINTRELAKSYNSSVASYSIDDSEEILRNFAEQGRPEAQYLLGRKLRWKKKQEGKNWIRKAVDNEYSPAIIWWGTMESNGNRDSSLFYLTRAMQIEKDRIDSGKISTSDYQESITELVGFLLGSYYPWGQYNRVFEDCNYYPGHSASIPWLKDLATIGYIPHIYRDYLALWYYKGEGVRQDYAEAFRWAESAARDGNGYSALKLAEMYLLGKGTKKDLQEAENWAKEGIRIMDEYGLVPGGFWTVLGDIYREQGRFGEAIKCYLEDESLPMHCEEASWHLADFYFEGIGVKQDANKAFSLYQKAWERGNAIGNSLPNALAGIGECLYYGKGTEKSISSALDSLKKASDQGSLRGRYLLGRHYCSYVPEKYYEGVSLICSAARDYYPAALSWIEKKQDLGLSEIDYSMGVCYYFGRGKNKDISKAISYLTKAANQGNLQAASLLSDYYLGVDNYQEALSYMYSAVRSGSKTAYSQLISFLHSHMYDNPAVLEQMKQIMSKQRDDSNYAHTIRGICLFPTDEKHSKKELTVAAQADDQLAMRYLFLLFNDFHWAERAKNKGDIETIRGMGDYYYSKATSEQDVNKKKKLLKKASDAYFYGCMQDDIYCMERNSSLCFYYETDPISALLLSKSAALRGDMKSTLLLARIYRKQFHSGSNDENNKMFYCITLLRIVADSDDISTAAEAQFELGDCYLNEQLLGYDKEEALRWFNKAAKNGNESAARLLADDARVPTL